MKAILPSPLASLTIPLGNLGDRCGNRTTGARRLQLAEDGKTAGAEMRSEVGHVQGRAAQTLRNCHCGVSNKPNPAALAAGRAGDRFNSLAALNGPQIAQALPAFQASFRASEAGR